MRVHTIVISVQHDETISLENMRRTLKERVIQAVVPAKYLDEKTIYHLQPSGRFVIGGPQVCVVLYCVGAFISLLLSLSVCLKRNAQLFGMSVLGCKKQAA